MTKKRVIMLVINREYRFRNGKIMRHQSIVMLKSCFVKYYYAKQ